MQKISDLERQTRLTLKELKEQLQDSSCVAGLAGCMGCMPATSMPTGLVINEIGIIFLTEENPEAENVLIEALSMDSFDAAIPAYAYLTSALHLNMLSEKAEKAVKDFEKGPQGEVAVNFVAEVGLITK